MIQKRVRVRGELRFVRVRIRAKVMVRVRLRIRWQDYVTVKVKPAHGDLGSATTSYD